VNANELRQQKILLQITNAIITQRTREGLFREVTTALHPIFNFDHISILLDRPGEDSWDLFSPAIGVEVPGFPKEIFPMKGAKIPYQAMKERKTIIADLTHELNNPESKFLLAAGLQWFICAPLIMRDKVIGSVQLCYKEHPHFLLNHIDLLEKVAQQLSLVIDNTLAYEKLQSVRDILVEEKKYLKKELDLMGESNETY
jgi:GAF domain-containing protein